MRENTKIRENTKTGAVITKHVLLGNSLLDQSQFEIKLVCFMKIINKF